MKNRLDLSADEAEAVRLRYELRTDIRTDWRYSFLNPAVWQSVLERQRETVRFFSRFVPLPLSSLQLVDVGCGEGNSLLEFLRFGMEPSLLQGLELLEARAEVARKRLPEGIALHVGDAMCAPIAEQSQDIVFQSVVFSSLLDDTFQTELAAAMWRWLRPGGAVLWYDFTYDNPQNPDVRGVSLKRIRELFPMGTIYARRITLAPPIARRVSAVHPVLYDLLNALPILRTHLLCWITKP